ncbi:hypothetical protein J7E90_31705 [Streptomyces sp. ISL-111]|uniref:hypothetical protein n=1 Tax=unclassified Streptomyces TaxID=2593676 RepID=UPI001BE689FB|nr:MULTISPECIES: hypothetical protein [unclassified Streptomyces]MBT2381731.1 hypothetical protein [Streptomyces sp. ISL-111]MBT2429153.1 hypothetical protein [Streptomyces sp. ISL-112]MBT2465717.1 hypothetical protein [Streptomyces sp. ISL-63]
MENNLVEPAECDIYHVVTEPEFTALFMLGADDLAESVEDSDAEIRLPNGTRWSASFMTLGAIERVMNRWRETGEHGDGVFFACSDLVIIPKGGVAAMVEAFRVILAEGPQGTLEKLE